MSWIVRDAGAAGMGVVLSAGKESLASRLGLLGHKRAVAQEPVVSVSSPPELRIGPLEMNGLNG